MNVVSLFSGVGGLDYGFRLAGFDIAAAVESARTACDTYSANHADTRLIKAGIKKVTGDMFSGIHLDGVIGGPPQATWAWAASTSNISQSPGQQFYEYIRLLGQLRPRFFVAETLPNLLNKSRSAAFENIISQFNWLGYNVQTFVLNAKDFGAAQDRKRVILIGFQELVPELDFSPYMKQPMSLKEAIGDLRDTAVPAMSDNSTNPVAVNSHEFYTAPFSARFVQNRKRKNWQDVGYMVLPSAEDTQLHPDSPPMLQLERNLYTLQPGLEHLYRRLTVRETARLQGFPDSFTFRYQKVTTGYRLVGGSVQLQLASAVAETIKNALFK